MPEEKEPAFRRLTLADRQTIERLSDGRLREPRRGIDTTSETFWAMIETAKPLIKKQGQSIAHVWAGHRDEFLCSERTLYRYVDLGLGGMKNLDLPAKCRKDTPGPSIARFLKRNASPSSRSTAWRARARTPRSF